MTIGLGVEGPSDFKFWNKVLHKHFRGHRFDIRNMKTREKLIRETPTLFEEFRSNGYATGIILVDMDDDPCITSVIALFNSDIVAMMRDVPRDERYLHLCVAIKEIESWYLADAEAINAVIAGCSWQTPQDTHRVSKGRVRTLIKEQCGRRASFNEITFAQDMAPKFDPQRARSYSASFRYFWEILENTVTGH